MKNFKMRSVLALIALLAITLSVVTAVAHAAANKGEKAPAFTLPSLNGKKMSLDQVRKDTAKSGKNRVVVLDFWATWCPPCQMETKHLQRLHEKYQKNGVAVLGIALDSGGAADVKPFVKEHKLTYTILSDSNSEVARNYGIRSIPVTMVLDRKGIIRYTHTGFYPGMEKELDSEVRSLLK